MAYDKAADDSQVHPRLQEHGIKPRGITLNPSRVTRESNYTMTWRTS
jgi:hypothetical protein